MDVKYTMMPENTSLGNGLTVVQACSEALTRAGYERNQAQNVSAMLYDAVDGVLEQHGLRTVFHALGGANPMFSMLAEMAKLDAESKTTQVVSIKALARQFAMFIPNQIGNHLITGSSFRTRLRMKLNPKDPVELQRVMQDLYRINYWNPVEPHQVQGRTLEMEYAGCSVDEVFEAAKVFNKQVEDAGSWPAFVTGLVKDTYHVHHILDDKLKMESKYPRVPALTWSEERKPSEGTCGYDHVISTTLFGDIRIEWKSWKEYDSYTVYMPFEVDGSSPVFNGYTLDEAKELAYRYYNFYLQKAFGYDVREPE